MFKIRKDVVFEDLYRATGPKVHHVDCLYYKRWLDSPTSTTTWHGPYKSKEKAWKICKEIASKSRFQPSKHRCVIHEGILQDPTRSVLGIYKRSF